MAFAAVVATLLFAPLQAPKEFPSEALDLRGAIGINGKPAPIETSKHKATVLLFVATDCPVANRYAPEIGRISDAYTKKGVEFYRVYLQPTDQAPAVKKHGKDYKLSMTPLLDTKRALAKKIGIRVTPEAAVIGPSGKLLYRGRIDGQNIEHGKVRPDYRRDLRIALDEILAGKPVSVKETVAIGCFIGE